MTTPTFAIVTATVTTAAALKLDAHLRQGDTILTCCTNAKVQRAGLYALGSCLPWFAANTSNNDRATIFCSLLGSAACVLVASQILDYEDNEELAKMRQGAAHMTFDELVQKHGIRALTQHNIVADIQTKFIDQHVGMTFTQIIQRYPLSEIALRNLCPLTNVGFLHNKFVTEALAEKSNFLAAWNSQELLYTSIMSPAMYLGLQTLKTRLSEIEQNYSQQLKVLHERYPERTDIQQFKFAERERNIPVEAKKFGEQVASQARGSALHNAVGNAVYDGNTKHVVRDSKTGLAVADVARKSAENAAAQRMRQELQQERNDPIKTARGAKEQTAYNQGKADAEQFRNASIASLELDLQRVLSL